MTVNTTEQNVTVRNWETIDAYQKASKRERELADAHGNIVKGATALYRYELDMLVDHTDGVPSPMYVAKRMDQAKYWCSMADNSRMAEIDHRNKSKELYKAAQEA